MSRPHMTSSAAIEQINIINGTPILIENNAGVTLEKKIFGEGKDDGKIDFSDGVDLKVVKVKIVDNEIIVIDDIFITTANMATDVNRAFAGSRCESKLHMLLVPWYQTENNSSSSSQKFATYGTPVKVDIRTDCSIMHSTIESEWTSINKNSESHKNSGIGYNLYSKRKGTGRSPIEKQHRAYYLTKYATSQILKTKQDINNINFFPKYGRPLTIKEINPRKIRVTRRQPQKTLGLSIGASTAYTRKSKTPRASGTSKRPPWK